MMQHFRVLLSFYYSLFSCLSRHYMSLFVISHLWKFLIIPPSHNTSTYLTSIIHLYKAIYKMGHWPANSRSNHESPLLHIILLCSLHLLYKFPGHIIFLESYRRVIGLQSKCSRCTLTESKNSSSTLLIHILDTPAGNPVCGRYSWAHKLLQ